MAKSRPLKAWSMDPRPDSRRLVCDRCRTAVYICSWCDRGHRYCSRRCREAARRQTLVSAGRRYQQTRRGRRRHACRQQAYRERQKRKVTHHPCRTPSGSATVAACVREGVVRHQRMALEPPGRRELRCKVCGEACERVVRHDFLRCRRPPRVPGGRRHDLSAFGRRDPSSV